MFDCHIHTKFSSDSTMKIEEVMEASNKLHIGTIITEHIDLKYPEEGKFNFDIDKYFSEYKRFRNEDMLIGVEIGMRNDCINEYKKIAEEHSFDIIIGSIHMVNGSDIFFNDFYEGKGKKQAYIEYFENMYECLNKFDFINTLGHIDYISRYAPFDDKEIYYKDYGDYIDEILKVLIHKGKAIEINSRRLQSDFVMENLTKIYKRYNELGGEMVTLGSDAHKKEDVGRNILKCKYMAECCNLKIVHYKEGKPYLD